MTSDNSIKNIRLIERGERFIPQGIGGYDECWYPICLSSDVSSGEVKGFEFLNGKVIVFRDEQGKVSVLSAYCRHLGVDLSLAKVEGFSFKCPYHEWRYDQNGKCVETAVGDKPPPSAKLFEFACGERYGLVWAYNGTTPAYDLPKFDMEDNELEFDVRRGAVCPMDPFMLYSNTMDLQHLISLHGAKFETTPDQFDIREHTIAYEQEMKLPGLGHSRQSVKLHGTNCISLSSEMMGRKTFMMSTGLAVKGPKTITFNISATPKSTDKPGEEQMIQQHLKMCQDFGDQLNKEDEPIFQSVSPRLDNLSASDKALGLFFRYAMRYPRSNVAEDMICNDYIAAAQQ
ncbi:Rieske (2Fe-2S) protein [Pseudomaricurvus alkylphenolicus]|jgi:nitrite reductase/ring-hydroxylating ferredoxin subunit|uniref:Rieske (2Fe-2S) protein n=1 Tax=Pseudomaricurvus alkylphenolicus TaxID=1306991 RepID=UPI001421ADF4|nr:Rieske (2Fe-2S) protein [Pseudomaricurvus alkylphenolicus]NIB38083.1 Rieske (2Fe-2S) protein [Pseudomaricurvus alkylphenolicus]